MITVACVWVKANVPFTAIYVDRLRNMVGKYLKEEHAFVCLTDRPSQVPNGIDVIEIKSPAPLPGWWAKIQLFNRQLGIRGRVMYLDLDVLVVGDLEPIASYPTTFALVPHAGNFEGRSGLRVVKKYNSSVMVWNTYRDGIERIHDDWTMGVSRRLWGDQDWIAELFPYERTMPIEWFPRLSEFDPMTNRTKKIPWPEQAKVVLCKRPKNHEAVGRWPWFAQAWR